MKRLIKILLLTVLVMIINGGFAMPMIHCFWNLTGYEVVGLIPRWAGREFYILLLIPISSVLLLLSEILFPYKRRFIFLLFVLLDFSFAFTVYEIIFISFLHPKDALSITPLTGYYLIVIGIILLNCSWLIYEGHAHNET
jgi:hypothetical protein